MIRPNSFFPLLVAFAIPLLLANVSLAQVKGKPPVEFLLNGSVDSVDNWSVGDGRFDGEAGRTAKGSLRIESDESGGAVSQLVELNGDLPSRLKFSGHVKTVDLKSFASVRLMAILTGEEQPQRQAYGEYVQEDTMDWKQLSLVFDLPPGYTNIRVMAYMSGKGTAWLDDLSLQASKEPVTKVPFPRPAEHAYWDWIRNSAASIPWTFDLEDAQRESAKQHKPVLIYVRCIEAAGAQLESAQTSLRADEVWASDDGFAKDVLFRAGALADGEISRLIKTRFIPIIHTYQFGRDFDKEIVKGVTRDDAVTPALIILAPDGKVAGRLHRIGLVSVDVIDHWLRSELSQFEFESDDDLRQLFDAGELEKVISKTSDQPEQHRLLRAKCFRRLGKLDEAEAELKEVDSPEAQFEKSLVSVRRGDWQEALERLETLGADKQAQFLKAWCLHRLGNPDEAFEIWNDLVADSDLGRQAALCLLPGQDPKLWMAGSQLVWPRQTKLDNQSESASLEFDPRRSIERLLEFQQPNGAWGWHDSGPLWSQAMTAIATEALWRWQDKLDDKQLLDRIADSHARGVKYLEEYAQAAYFSRIDVFVAPYVLEHLLQLKRVEPATALVKKLVGQQLADGSWTYRGDASTSFNTAHVLVALQQAATSGIEVPKESIERGLKALAAMRAENDVFPYAPPKGFQWMTTEHGSIARDPLCETALLMGKSGDQAKLQAALTRFSRMAHELRDPTKRYSSYFNKRGHGSYFFFYAHQHALRATEFVEDQQLKSRVRELIKREVLSAQEFDGTFIDHYMYGRSYGTAMALLILADE